MSKIVISAVALEGFGTLSILQDCLHELSNERYGGIEIHVLLKDRKLVNGEYNKFKFIELDGARSYFHKFYYEYFYFRKLSKKLMPDLWISLHDITPNVVAKNQVVYCHNPAPFYKISLREFFLDLKFGSHTLFYWLVYKINIHRNTWIVVQQDWIREEFHRRFGVSKEKIIVSHPNIFFSPQVKSDTKKSEKKIFFFPTYPRSFKNIEIICEAVVILNKRNVRSFEVILTVDGKENRYAHWLKSKYESLPEINWIGKVSRDEVFELYDTASCLLFPSKLETWGLPLSEFKPTGKPILVANLPYATETLGNYDKAIFFDPYNSEDLANKMEELILDKEISYSKPKEIKIGEPMATDWTRLFEIIIPKSADQT